MTGRDYPGFDIGDDTVIWRYQTFGRFQCVLDGRLYFAAAHQFDDSFEGAVTDAERAARVAAQARLFPTERSLQASILERMSAAFGELRRLTKINCWQATTHENVAMWERYTRSSPTGIAVKSTVGSVKRALREFRLRPEYGEEPIYVGRVKYLDYAVEPLGAHSMLDIFFRKRVEYRDESEVRLVLPLRGAEEFGVPVPRDGVIVDIDARTLVHEV